VLYRAFIDDSADKRQKTTVVAGALVSAHSDWTQFGNLWKQKLKAGGIEYYRSTEYYGLNGQFSKFRDPVNYPKPAGRQTAAALVDGLESIIKASPLAGIAGIVPIQTYKEFRATVPGAAAKLHEDAFGLVLQTVIMECAYLVRDKMPGFNRIAFVCDDGPKAELYSRAYAEFKHKNPVIAQVMNGLVHLDDKKWPQLQAADMVASLGKEASFQILQNPPEMIDSRTESGDARRMATRFPVLSRLRDRMYSIHMWDWHYLTELLNAQSQ
jgi:hypothetical protein